MAGGTIVIDADGCKAFLERLLEISPLVAPELFRAHRGQRASGFISRAACNASAKCGSFLRVLPYQTSSVASAQRSTSAKRALTEISPRRAAATQPAYSFRSARASNSLKSDPPGPFPPGNRS